jgi:hypothetical protein
MTQVRNETNGTRTAIMDNEADYKENLNCLKEWNIMEINGHGFDMDLGFWINYTQK